MAYNGSGVFNRLYSWVQDALNGIPISSTRMDAEDNGFAAGLTNCITRDGQSPAQANLPMGGFKLTNIANAAQRNEYVSLGQQQDNAARLGGTVGGTANAITFNLTPAITAYVAGQEIFFVATANNSGAVTVNVNGVGVKNVLGNDGAALVGNAIRNGQLVQIVYDGTQFQLQNPVGGTGTLLAIQYLTATGTYTPTAGTRTAIAQVQAAGGSGGSGSAGSSVGIGGGGGAGGYAIVAQSNPIAQAYTIGAAGAAATNAVGNAAAATVFGGVTCNGGGAGAIGNTAPGTSITAVGGAGGTITGGSPSISIAGQDGGAAISPVIAAANPISIAGAGGDSQLGNGGAQIMAIAAAVVGKPGTGYGSGGSGNCSPAAQGAAASGAGMPGLIIVHEYA